MVGRYSLRKSSEDPQEFLVLSSGFLPESSLGSLSANFEEP